MFWTAITVRLFFMLPADEITALNGAYGSLSTSIWLFAAAAFGIDAFMKQGKQE